MDLMDFSGPFFQDLGDAFFFFLKKKKKGGKAGLPGLCFQESGGLQRTAVLSASKE